jgi:pimeloyl-ACP methyl ester carboxylesterase
MSGYEAGAARAPAAHGEPSPAGPWPWGPLPQVRRAYADTPAGQIHYRRAGEGLPLVLLHWTPGSGAQYEPVLPALAGHGIAAHAPDLPGFGASCPAAHGWRVEDFAASVIAFCDAVGLERFALLGGHLSSEIAACVETLIPQRVTHLVLDGSPVWDREFRERVLANVQAPGPPACVEDGSHLQQWWQGTLWLLRTWRPGLDLGGQGGLHALQVMLYDLQSRFERVGVVALREFEMAECLARVRAASLVLTASTDPLRGDYDRVRALLPHAASHEFEGDHPLHNPARSVEYARKIASFLNG